MDTYTCSGDVHREHDLARLAVHVIKGDSLFSGSTGGRPADTQAHVTVFQRDGVVSFKTTSRIAKGELVPDWSLVSVIDIADEDPLDCCISLQVKRLPPFNLGFRRTLCAYYAPLRSLLSLARRSARILPNQGFGSAESASDGLSEPFWLNCQNKGRQKGRLLVQVQFIQRVRVRPLKVLVVTWNMGSAPPSASFSKCFPDSETGAYDLIVVGTQESAVVPKLADESMEEDVSRMSSPGPASPSAGREPACTDSAAPHRPTPSSGPSDTFHQRRGQTSVGIYAPEDSRQRQMDTGTSMRPMSPERSSSAPVPSSKLYPSHVPRPRGYIAQQLHSSGAPDLLGHNSRAARHALAVLSEPEAIDLVPITMPADQVLGGSIPEEDEEEYGYDNDQAYSQQGYAATDVAATADEGGHGSQHQYVDEEQHTYEGGSEILDDEELHEDDEDVEEEEDDGTARLAEEEGGDDGPFGFRSIGIVGQRDWERTSEPVQSDIGAPDAPRGALTAEERGSGASDEIPEPPPVPVTPLTVGNVVPLLQMPRGKSHLYGDYLSRDSGRGSVQSLRMPVVHEEGESIAGSSSALGEEQPPAPGAVSVSGRQVTETGEVLVEDETSTSSPGETDTLQIDEPFVAVRTEAPTQPPTRPTAPSLAATSPSSSASAREVPGAARYSEQTLAKKRSAVEPMPLMEVQPTPAYGRLVPKSLPAKLARVRIEEEDTEEHGETRVARSEGPHEPSPAKKRRFSDSVVSGGALKATVAQRARAWVDTESFPVLHQLLEDLAEGQERGSQRTRSHIEPSASAETDGFPELAGSVQDDSALASDRGGVRQQGTVGESSTDRSGTDHPSGYRAEQESYVSLSEPWGDGRTPSYPASSQDHTALDTVSQRILGSAELSTVRSDMLEPASAGAVQPSLQPRPGFESAISLEPQGAPELPFSPFGSGALTSTSAHQSPPRSPRNASSSAFGSSAQGAQPDSLAPTEISLRHSDEANEATLFIHGSSGTQMNSPHNTTSSGSRNTNTPPASLGASQNTHVGASRLQFSSIHVVWPNEPESGSNTGGSATLTSMQAPQGVPSAVSAVSVSTTAAATEPLPASSAGRHLDGDEVLVDPNATFSSDSSWAAGVSPRHMWTPRTMPERSLSMPDLPPDLEDAAAMHASHAQHSAPLWPWQAVGLLGVGAGSAPGTPTGGREMDALARQKEREATAATASSAFDKALREEGDGPSSGPSSGPAQRTRGRGGPWTRGPAPGVWKKMQPGSPSLPLRTPFSGGSEGTADRSRGAGRGQYVGSSRGLSPMSEMSPTSAPLMRGESNTSTIIQDFDRVVSSSTDIGEIYETVMQHACAGALVARAREVSRERERRDSVASGGGSSSYGYPRLGRLYNTPESQQSTASVRGGPRSLDSFGSTAGIRPRPPLPPGGASSVTGASEESAPGLRTRGGAGEPDSAFSGSVSADAEEPADAPQVGGTDEISFITEQQQEGSQIATTLAEIGQRRPSDESVARRVSDAAPDDDGHSRSSTPDSSDAYFGVLTAHNEQFSHPAEAGHATGDPQGGSGSNRGSAMSRALSGDITPRLHGLQAAVTSEAPMSMSSPTAASFFQASPEEEYPVASSAADMAADMAAAAQLEAAQLEVAQLEAAQRAVEAPEGPGWSAERGEKAEDAQVTVHTNPERSPRSQELPSSRLEAREHVGTSQSWLTVSPLDMPTTRSITFSDPSSSSSARTPSFPTPISGGIIDVTSSYHPSIDQPPSVGGPQGEYPTDDTPEQRRFLRSRGQTVSSQDTVSQSTVHPSSVASAYHTRGQPISQTGASSTASVQRPQAYYGRDSYSSGGGNPWSGARSQGHEPSSSTATVSQVSQPSMADLAPQFPSLTPGSGSTGSLSTALTFAAGLPDTRSKHAIRAVRRTGSVPSQESEGRAPRSTTSARGTSTDTQKTRSTAVGTDSLMDGPHIPSDMSMSGALPDSAIAGATGATLANWVGSAHGLSDASRALYSSKSRSFSHSMSEEMSTRSLSHSMTQSLKLPRLDSNGNWNGGAPEASDTGSDTPLLPRSGRSGDSLSSGSVQPAGAPSRTYAAAAVAGAPESGAETSSGGVSSRTPELGSQGDSSRSVASRPLSGGMTPSQIPIRQGSDLARYASLKPPLQARRGHSTGSRSLPGGEGVSGSGGRSMHGRSARRSRTSSASGVTSGMSLRATSARAPGGSHSANRQSLSDEVLVPSLLPLQPPLQRGHSAPRGGRQMQARMRVDELRESVRDRGQLDAASVSSGGGSTTFAVASSASGGLGERGVMGSRTAAFVGDYQMSDRLEPTHQRSLITPSQRAAEHWSTPGDIRARTTSPRGDVRDLSGESAQGKGAGAPTASPGSPAATQGSQGSLSPRHTIFDAPADTPFMLTQHAPGRRRPQVSVMPQVSQASQQGRPGAPQQSSGARSRDQAHSSYSRGPQRGHQPFPGSPQRHPGLVVPTPPPLTTATVSDPRHSTHGRQPSRPVEHSSSGQASERQRFQQRLPRGGSRPEGSISLADGSHSTHSRSTSPRDTSPSAASAWYGQPRDDGPARPFSTAHTRPAQSGPPGGPTGIQDGFQHRAYSGSRSGAVHSTRAAEPAERGSARGSMPGSSGHQSPQDRAPQGPLPAWTRRSLSLSQSDVRLGDLEERVSRHTTAGTHVSDESDVEWEVARGPEGSATEGSSSQQLQAASSGLLARMRSGLRMSRSATGVSSPQHQHSQDLPSERPEAGSRGGHRPTQSGSSPPAASPLTLVNANELQSALRSVASTMDSLRVAGAAAPNFVPAPTSASAQRPLTSPTSGLHTPGSAASAPVRSRDRRTDRRAAGGGAQGGRDGYSTSGVAGSTSEPQADLRNLPRRPRDDVEVCCNVQQTMDHVPWPDAVAAAVNAVHTPNARPGSAPFSRTSNAVPRYKVWKHVSMGQMRLVVLASNDMHMLLGNAAAATVATGVAGVGSNKGAVAISCHVWGNQLCFVNAHLAAHQSKVRERNKMYRTIAKELRMRTTSESLLSSFHHVFFMGDLNYRLDYGGGADFRDGTPNDTLVTRFQKDLMYAHNNGEYSSLLQMDQLRRMQEVGHAFVDFHEADVQFPPTYKVEREASIAYKSRRLPAWCDRILWHSNLPDEMRPRCARYFMAAEVETSDHKPVGGIFVIPSVNSPAQVVTDVTDNFVIVLTGLKAEGLLVEKMKPKKMGRIRAIGCNFPQLRNTIGIRLRARGDDFQHQAKALSNGIGGDVDWKHEVKMHCKHAYTEHIRGRMLHFKVSFDAGSGRTRRTIGQAALPLMSVLPQKDLTPAGWPQGHSREEWPFSIPLYHGGLRAGKLTGAVRWSLRRNDSIARLAHMKRGPGPIGPGGPALTLSPSGHLTEASTNPGAAARSI